MSRPKEHQAPPAQLSAIDSLREFLALPEALQDLWLEENDPLETLQAEGPDSPALAKWQEFHNARLERRAADLE